MTEIFNLVLVSTCPALPVPSNGIRQICTGKTIEHYNTICLFSCYHGFNGFGSSSRKCLENGTWSGRDFFCLGEENLLLQLLMLKIAITQARGWLVVIGPDASQLSVFLKRVINLIPSCCKTNDITPIKRNF